MNSGDKFGFIRVEMLNIRVKKKDKIVSEEIIKGILDKIVQDGW